MRTSLWRSIHLILAFLVSIFLVIAAITGGLLAFDKSKEKLLTPYVVGEQRLSEVIPKIESQMFEITELRVVHGQLIVKGFDENRKEVQSVVNPENGKLVGKPPSKSQWIRWVRTLHRSLFLNQTGRLIVGVVAVLFLLSLLTGFVLLYRRQGHRVLRNPEVDTKTDLIHFLGGKWFALPLLVLALTGSVLFLFRLGWLNGTPDQEITFASKKTGTIASSAFPIFRETRLDEVRKLTFPMFEDEAEYFELVTTKATFKIHQFTGEVVSEVLFSAEQLLGTFTMRFHTGDLHFIWAFVLMLSAFLIPLLVVSGFLLWWRRKPKKIANIHLPEEAEYIVLVGSEGGTTWQFAQKVFHQLLSAKVACYIASLNDYQLFPMATKLLIFTSTYGDGEAPSNATNAIERIKNTPQKQLIAYSILGFGSQSFPAFCAFAKELEIVLSQQKWAKQMLPLHTVDGYSVEEMGGWIKQWNAKATVRLLNNPSYYALELPPLHRFEVLEKSALDAKNLIFSLVLKPLSKGDFLSGDLLAIYPEHNHKERLYSIGKVGDNVHLFIKLHENGLGSQYLYQLSKGKKINARIVANSNFHFPVKASEVLMIANGTGVAPFVAMMRASTSRTKKILWVGFRYESSMTKEFATQAMQLKHQQCLADFSVVYSQGIQPLYVTDLVKQSPQKIVQLLQSGGVIMLCGSLAMQRDVEAIVETICETYQLPPLRFYKENHQILADCY